MTLTPRSKKAIGYAALIGAGVIAFHTGMCRVMEQRAEESQKKTELEQRIKNAPHRLIHYVALPTTKGQQYAGFPASWGPTQIELARRELNDITAPRFIGSQNTTDLYLRDLRERTRQINPKFQLGQSGDIVAADLKDDGKIGGVYTGKPY